MKSTLIPVISMSILLWLPVSGSGAVPTTRQQTIIPVAIPPGTPPIAPSNVPLYAVYGYSAWQLGPGTNEGRKFDLMPAGYTGAKNMTRLLSFFSMSDVHITDKESPAQALYFGWSAPFLGGGFYISGYSPIILSTTHVLDAAVKTINALHSQTPFDFGICLGDPANNTQLNELRWFIDVMDGQYITPSSGAHLGADTIDYQMPYQAAGLNRSIPWYQVIGNHDQFWVGSLYMTEKTRSALVGSNVLNIGTNILAVNNLNATGMYVGVVDGTTRYGDVIKGGLTNLFETPPTIAADTNRHTITTDDSTTTNFMSEFFNTVSLPAGHGFTRANIESNSACYTFEPLINMPIKVIVLDDMPKTNVLDAPPNYGALGQVDAVRLAWLTNELQMGQDAEQIMIIATHIPILPQTDLFVTNSAPQFYNYQTETNLLATLHNYPNLLLVMAGHRHMSVVTPHPSPDPAHPEYGFWEVETPSLRDFPQQFRTWDIRRNSDNTISILTTDVDFQVETNSPAWKSRGYAIGAARIFNIISFTDTTSHTFNAELVKKLTPAMQAKIARYGSPLQHAGNDYDSDGKSDLAVYRNGYWSIYLMTGNVFCDNAPLWIGPDYIPVPGDYDGDGKSDLAVYRDGYWSIYTMAGGVLCDNVPLWVGPDYIPVPGDYDGDGKSDLAVYRAGYWSIYTMAGSVLCENMPLWVGPDYIPVR